MQNRLSLDSPGEASGGEKDISTLDEPTQMHPVVFEHQSSLSLDAGCHLALQQRILQLYQAARKGRSHYQDVLNDIQSSLSSDDLQRIQPHIEQSKKLSQNLHQKDRQLHEQHLLIDRFPAPIFAFDRTKLRRYQNQAAYQWLSKRSLLDSQKYLCFKHKSNQLAFHYALQHLDRQSDTSTSFVIQATPPKGLQSDKSPTEKLICFLFYYPEARLQQQPEYWLYILTPTANLEMVRKMERLTHLSPTEQQLCEYFLNGADLNTIAAERNTAIDTVRKQVKHLLKKCQCNDQESLMVYLFQQLHDQIFTLDKSTKLLNNPDPGQVYSL